MRLDLQLNSLNWVLRRLGSATQFPQLSLPQASFRETHSAIANTLFYFSKMEFYNYVSVPVLSALGLRIHLPTFPKWDGFHNFILATFFSTIFLSCQFLARSFLTVDLTSYADLTLTLRIFTFLFSNSSITIDLLKFAEFNSDCDNQIDSWAINIVCNYRHLLFQNHLYITEDSST